jgi:hypothetical protein
MAVRATYRVTIIDEPSGEDRTVMVEASSRADAIVRVASLGEIVTEVFLDSVKEQVPQSELTNTVTSPALPDSPSVHSGPIPVAESRFPVRPDVAKVAAAPNGSLSRIPASDTIAVASVSESEAKVRVRPIARAGSEFSSENDRAIEIAVVGIIIPLVAIYATFRGLVLLYRSNGSAGTGASLLGIAGILIWILLVGFLASRGSV